MQKAFGKKSVIFMFLFPAFLIYTAFVIVSIVWAGYYTESVSPSALYFPHAQP